MKMKKLYPSQFAESSELKSIISKQESSGSFVLN